MLQILSDKEELFKHESEGCTWHPEFGAWMIESTPSRPYSHYATDLLRIERNMVLRRRRLLSVLNENEIIPTVRTSSNAAGVGKFPVNLSFSVFFSQIPCFPLLGVGDYIHDPKPFEAPHSQSLFIPDYIINPHPRFAALTRNIRERRGEKVDIQVPLFRDEYTPEFLVNDLSPDSKSIASYLLVNFDVEGD